VITTPESVDLIMDCYPDGLIVADGTRWGDPAHVDAEVIHVIEARADEVELPAAAMHAYFWRQPDDAKRAEACAHLPARLGEEAMAGLERSPAP
jgi:hypothetical protein